MPIHKILVVDDNEDIRLLMLQALEATGFDVIGASNGKEAATAARTHAIDLVVTDVLMPDADGLELINELRRRNATCPIIVMSGGGQVGGEFYLNIARRLGAKRVLLKPFTIDELLEAVQATLPG